MKALDKQVHPRVLKSIGREDAVAAIYGREALARIAKTAM